VFEIKARRQSGAGHLAPAARQSRVSNAILVADPVDAIAAAAGVAVTELDPPMRRTAGLDVIERALHRAPLLSDAGLLPLAIDADVEGDGVVKHRARLSACAERHHDECRNCPQEPLHRRPKRYSGLRVPQPPLF